jgi:hypothetical protein
VPLRGRIASLNAATAPRHPALRDRPGARRRARAASRQRDPERTEGPHGCRLRHATSRRLVAIGEPSLSPDAGRAAYLRSEVVGRRGRVAATLPARLHVVDLDEGRARPSPFEQSAATPLVAVRPFVAFLATPRAARALGRAHPARAAAARAARPRGRGMAASATSPPGSRPSPWGARRRAPPADHPRGLARREQRARDRALGRRRMHRFDGVGWLPRGPVSLWRVARDEGGSVKRRHASTRRPTELR